MAIGISSGLQKEILDWEKGYENLPVRWLFEKNLHITVIPPWYDDDEGIKNNKIIFKEAAETINGFEFSLNRVSYGPDSQSPRLIWAEGRETPKELIKLKNNLDGILKIGKGNRPFKLHLTLARFRQENFSGFPVKTLNDNINWSEKARSILLMESHLSSSGADYEILEEFPFKNNQ
jgi:2'-5' RNA ligase